MKKMIVVMIAASLAIGFSAFTGKTIKTDNRPAPEYWFQLVPGGTPSNPLDYSMVGDGSTPPSCNSGSNRCAILTEKQGPSDPNPGFPFVNTYSQERKRPTP